MYIYIYTHTHTHIHTYKLPRSCRMNIFSLDSPRAALELEMAKQFQRTCQLGYAANWAAGLAD